MRMLLAWPLCATVIASWLLIGVLVGMRIRRGLEPARERAQVRRVTKSLPGRHYRSGPRGRTWATPDTLARRDLPTEGFWAPARAPRQLALDMDRVND